MNLLGIDIKIIEFLEKLTKRESSQTVFNQYKSPFQHNNLFIYLNQAQINGADILFLGEAAGYKGCRITGVPFSANYNIKNSKCFSQLRKSLFLGQIDEKRESTSTIFHEFINKKPSIYNKIVVWNVFPFHSYDSGNHNSNRTPSHQELVEGQDFILDLFKIFKFKQYYPIGASAETCLTEMRVNNIIPPFEFFRIRHPSHGGKVDFIKGMKRIFNIREKIQIKLV
ncbi:MAG: uracil-DNA glycosylase [Promethearchaeota archaeon]